MGLAFLGSFTIGSQFVCCIAGLVLSLFWEGMVWIHSFRFDLGTIGNLFSRLLALSRGQVQARFGADLGCVLRDGFGMV